MPSEIEQPACDGVEPRRTAQQAAPTTPPRRRWLGVGWAGIALCLVGFLYAVDWLVANSSAAPTSSAEDTPAETPSPPSTVGALGFIEPRDGVIRLAGPLGEQGIVEELRVAEGDILESGQIVAVLRGARVKMATVSEAEADLAQAEKESRRTAQLQSGGVTPLATMEAADSRQRLAAARLARARAEFEMMYVRAPSAGRVLAVHASVGERIDGEGIIELGDTSAMYASAEIHEMDVMRVHVGQRARIESPVFETPLRGVVDRIGWRIGRNAVLSPDPIAEVDARVIEVKVRIDAPETVERLTNLTVEVILEP